MTNIRDYWTKEKITEAALKCSTKKEFLEKFAGAFNAARKLNILDDVCSHMTNVCVVCGKTFLPKKSTINTCSDICHEKHRKEQDKTYNKKWRKENQEYFKDYMLVWREENQEYLKEYSDDYEKLRERYHTDKVYKLTQLCISAINQAFQRQEPPFAFFIFASICNSVL